MRMYCPEWEKEKNEKFLEKCEGRIDWLMGKSSNGLALLGSFVFNPALIAPNRDVWYTFKYFGWELTEIFGILLGYMCCYVIDIPLLDDDKIDAAVMSFSNW